jgi:hypothetical protein
MDSWDLNCAIWQRHLELVNVEDDAHYANYAYKATFHPVSKPKRYIQVYTRISNIFS